ncbi:MAG TPA: polysaccharide biosynthesis/export family protein [Gemmatimonadota bacterium]|nr:polysaccharide biosynthesis/export family protein [Gemmatimonadota bacterium]
MIRHLTVAALLVGALAVGVRPSAAQDQNPARAAQSGPVSLRPGDLLRVSVWPDDSLGGEFVVEDGGVVYLPMLGAVRTGGVSIEQLRTQLRAAYAEIMKNPVVTVTPVFHVGVLGQVRSPGVYEITPTNSLLDVIGMAGGFAGDADAEKIRIVREDRTIRVDAERALEDGTRLLDLRLRSGDQIVVPAHGGRITFNGVISFIASAAAIGFAIDRVVSNH